jgi:hypothetical protein
VAKKKVKAITSTDKLARLLHALTHDVPEVAQTPWDTVKDSASIFADAVESGRYHLYLPEDQLLRERVALLLHIAVRVYAERVHTVGAQARSGRYPFFGWVSRGVVWDLQRDEQHARCLFCRESLATYGRRTVQIPLQVLVAWENHTLLCALRGLAGNHAHWRRPLRSERR